MAYCRYGHESDCYCYQSDVGYHVYPVFRHVVSPDPYPKHPGVGAPAEAFAAYFCSLDSWEEDNSPDTNTNCYYENLPSVNGSYLFDNPLDTLSFLKVLRLLGFRIPKYATDSLYHEVLAAFREYLDTSPKDGAEGEA